jgi:hypothetical protein
LVAGSRDVIAVKTHVAVEVSATAAAHAHARCNNKSDGCCSCCSCSCSCRRWATCFRCRRCCCWTEARAILGGAAACCPLVLATGAARAQGCEADVADIVFFFRFSPSSLSPKSREAVNDQGTDDLRIDVCEDDGLRMCVMCVGEKEGGFKCLRPRRHWPLSLCRSSRRRLRRRPPKKRKNQTSCAPPSPTPPLSLLPPRTRQPRHRSLARFSLSLSLCPARFNLFALARLLLLSCSNIVALPRRRRRIAIAIILAALPAGARHAPDERRAHPL